MKLDSLKDFIAPRRALFISLLLAAATLVVYGQAGYFDSTNYDDPHYIFDNPMVRGGLALPGVLWALSTRFYDFWHPLTWWSHMLDCELFGLKPGWHHLANVAFHVANTLVLFTVLRGMTGAIGRSAVAAALFALHPLHVESVAWLSERKDTLSTFFFLLTLLFYARYAQKRSEVEGRASSVQAVSALDSRLWTLDHSLALLFFALALMAKAMVVTLPFVLLLLDYWPLGRLSSFKFQAPSSAPQPSTLDSRLSTVRKLVWEKLPFFGLALASCAITYLGMKAGDNVLSAETVPWSLRLANVPVSYARYLGKTIWPVDLAVFYPMPTQWAFWQVGGAVLVLLVISLVVLAFARSAPYLIFGWFVFVGTLVPTIGLVPVGFQSIADRYTYLPSIGLFVAGVWVVADISVRWRFRTVLLRAATVLALLACGSLTWFQVRHWRNSFTLWTHCVAVTRENADAHYNLGRAFQQFGQNKEAMQEYRETLRLKPNYLNANLNLGVALAATGQLPEATNYFAKALRIKPDYAFAHIGLGNALCRLNDASGATNHYAQALLANPNDGPTHRVYALALLDLGDFAGTLAHASEAIRLAPKDFWAYLFAGRALSAVGRSDEALGDYSTALSLNPACAEAHYYLGLEWMKRGGVAEAFSSLSEAVRLDPASADAHFHLAVVLAGQRKTKDAVAQYREALRLQPDSPATLNNLAWILATQREADVRNGTEAVQLAEHACDRTSYKQTIFIGTLAAAYAEAGQFEMAVETAQRASDLASSLGQTNLFQRNQELLRQFKNREPWREPD